VSGYGLDNRAIGVRSPAEAKDFSSSLCVQTGSEAHPASCTMGTGGPFPGPKARLGATLTTQSHLGPRSRMSRSYTSSTTKRLCSVCGTASALDNFREGVRGIRKVEKHFLKKSVFQITSEGIGEDHEISQRLEPRYPIPFRTSDHDILSQATVFTD
jgi:hypothetical protein